MSGTVFGLLTDVLWRRLPHREASRPFEDLCRDCGCEEHGIVRSALVHTGKVALFLLLVNLVLGGAIHLVGEERISQVLLSGSVFQPLLAALIGFIPNCASSVILTELYLSGSLSFGAAGGRAVHRGRGGPGGAVPVQPALEGKPAAGGNSVRPQP